MDKILNGTTTEVVDGQTTQFEQQAIRRYDLRVKNSAPADPVSGWRNPTNYSRRVGKQTSPTVQFEHMLGNRNGFLGYHGTKTGYVDGSGYSMPPILKPGQPGYTDLQDETVIKCLAKFSESPIDIGVMLGERRESLEFLTDTAKRSLNMVKAVRKRNVADIKRQLRVQESRQRYHRSVVHEVLDAPTDLWLSSALAVKPMVADAYGTMEALENRENASPPSIKNIATGHRRVPHNPWINVPFNGIHYIIESTTPIQEMVKVRLDAEMRNDLLFKLSQVGVLNPLSLAWNLLPLSFVADYFSNIGDYFQATGSTAGLNFKAGSITVTCKRRLHWKFKQINPGSYTGKWFPVVIHTGVLHTPTSETATLRVTLSDWPSAITDYAPRFKNKLNPTRLLTVSSLLAQFTK